MTHVWLIYLDSQYMIFTISCRCRCRSRSRSRSSRLPKHRFIEGQHGKILRDTPTVAKLRTQGRGRISIESLQAGGHSVFFALVGQDKKSLFGPSDMFNGHG